MTRSGKLFLFVPIVILIFSSLACYEGEFIAPEWMRGTKNAPQQTVPAYFTGHVTGTMDTIYNVPVKGQMTTITCLDDQADYTIVYAAKPPADSAIQLPDPSVTYWRLVVYAATYLLNDNVCDMSGARTDDVVKYVIEGYYVPPDLYSIMSCGNSGSLTSAIGLGVMYSGQDKKTGFLEGDFTCVVSEQMQYHFRFANMELH